MAAQQTLALIKPDAIKASNVGNIIKKIEENNFKILQLFMLQLSKQEAEEFYSAHKDKPFFDDLTNFISSGEVIVMILDKANAIEEWRNLMGATNPKEAEKGTIRAEFAKSIDENSVHGSDSVEAAIEEISFFFDIDDETEEELDSVTAS